MIGDSAVERVDQLGIFARIDLVSRPDVVWLGNGSAPDGLGEAEFGGKQLGQPLLAARTTERNRFWNGQPVAR